MILCHVPTPQPLHDNGGKKQRLKGTVSRDILLLVFFMNQFPPSHFATRVVGAP